MTLDKEALTITLVLVVVFFMPMYIAFVLGIRNGLPQHKEKRIISWHNSTEGQLVKTVDLRNKIYMVLVPDIYDQWNLKYGSKESLGCYKLYYEYKVANKTYSVTYVVTGAFNIPSKVKVYYVPHSPEECVLENFERYMSYPYSISLTVLCVLTAIAAILYEKFL